MTRPAEWVRKINKYLFIYDSVHRQDEMKWNEEKHFSLILIKLLFLFFIQLFTHCTVHILWAERRGNVSHSWCQANFCYGFFFCFLSSFLIYHHYYCYCYEFLFLFHKHFIIKLKEREGRNIVNKKKIYLFIYACQTTEK